MKIYLCFEHFVFCTECKDLFLDFFLYKTSLLGSASELGRQISADPKTPGGPGSCSTIAEEAVDQLQENEKLVAGKEEEDNNEETFNHDVCRVHRDLGN